MSRRRRIPTKAELLQLQRLYKTDERIGERLGGVPAYLVAYWRRKKNIPKYSLPKFSEQEIRNLWERFGDDEKAGMELGISKAAFYNWRRRYGFREKPAFLKLEQLELNFPGARLSPHASALYGRRTMAQKIIARAAQREEICVGETVELEPDLVTVQGSITAVIDTFKSQGSEYVFNPSRIAVLAGHRDFSNSQKNNSPPVSLSDFARRQHIKFLYDYREGFSPQVVIEKGHILSGHLILASGGQPLAYGAVSALGIAVSTESMGEIWSSGKFSVSVPPTLRINIAGRRYPGVYAADIALFGAHHIGDGGRAAGKVIEYGGAVVSQMSISERFTLSDLSSTVDALGVICPYDATTRRYLTGRALVRSHPVIPDKNAEYEQVYQINIDHLVPQIAPVDVSSPTRPAVELEGKAVRQVVIGSCTSGHFNELRVAADVLKGKQVHRDCRLLIIPASRTTYLEALKKGLIRVFIEAGAVLLHPSECPCQGGPIGRLAANECCLATANPHLAEAIGTAKSEVYLCSAATAAASALRGEITDPVRFIR